ncbi:MAG: serine hydrolase [Candidatus Uhrbacteria bacterium]|nr:serine hydrolase [Patescibacteria group bacterium]MBU1907428.1 serine hydrolase [Patescibacteria group bacterium]
MKRWFTVLTLMFALSFPLGAFAFDTDAVRAIQAVRPDLRAAFDENGVAIAGTAAGFLIDIYDWAEQYGWREHTELASYAPESIYVPERVAGALEPEVTASSYIILDKNSGQILAARGADTVWPIASLTKLVTADVVLDSGVAMDKIWSVLDADDVGGAKLYVANDTDFTIEDLFYSTLVASANNAANALSRAAGLDQFGFLSAMNRRPFDLGLAYTQFVDPTGIELGNVSTAREMARLAGYVFARDEVRRYTTTAIKYIDVLTDGTTKRLKNTNWMLYYPEYEDVYVTAGKTGYLNESGWNLAVQLRPSANDTDRELLMIVFGAASRAESFADAKRLADWTWQSHRWQANPLMQ